MKSDNTTKKSFGDRFLHAVKGFFTKNLFLKVISLVFAVLLWSYVMMETNPERIKTVPNVSVSFDGETELLNKNLTVRGNRSEILPNITVEVNTQLTNYANMSAASINATVNLRAISKPDTYRLRINATCSGGTIVDITPSEIILEIDELGARTVPVEVNYVGDLPEDYWHGEPSLSAQNVTIRGAAEDVAQVVKAVCPINLTGRTGSYNESIGLVLMDANGETVNNALFVDAVPSVVARMDILKTATLRVDAAGALLGTDAMPSNFEIANVVSVPAEVKVAGHAADLEQLSTISIVPLDVSGQTVSVQQGVDLVVPEGITLLGDSNVNVYVDIREKLMERSFEDVEIRVQDGAKGKKITLDQSACDITVSGRISLIRDLSRGDITLYVDADNLANGVYEAPVLVKFANSDLNDEATYALSKNTVILTIQE